MADIFILGINVSHDVSCAILKNGILICAIAEERLNRIKRYAGGIDHKGLAHKILPNKSINYCLKAAGITLEEVELIVVSSSVVVDIENYKIRPLEKKDILEQLPNSIDKEKVIIVGHHIGHSASAYYCSGFSDAAVIVADGGGSLIEKENGNNSKNYFEERISVYNGLGKNLELKKQYVDSTPSNENLSNESPSSLGDFYQSATIFVGFGCGDEGKTMGLAPYGTNSYYKIFMDAIELNNAELKIRSDFQFNKWIEKKGKYYGGQINNLKNSNGSITQVHKDVAAAVQHALEETMIKLADEAYKLTKSKNLCLSGGVALNSVANKKILDNTPFENIFIQPASSDDGCALGNALIGWTEILGNKPVWKMKTAYTGRSYSDKEILSGINKYKGWLQSFEKVDAAKVASRLLSEKKIIGWFQGGSEFGPRSLGNRAIICDARYSEMKDILNSKVKHREGFRPFAPSILEEFNTEYFDIDCPSPYMLLIASVKKADTVPAITHVDKTARVQTVNKEDNGIYYDLINEYNNITGVPLILNSSFNVAGEPIVETPEDAIRCFLSTKIDYLVIEDVLLKKKDLKCLALKIFPQEVKRVLYRFSKNLYKKYPVLRKVKILTGKLLEIINNKSDKNIVLPG